MKRQNTVFDAVIDYYGALHGTREIEAVKTALIKNIPKELGLLDRRAFNRIKANLASLAPKNSPRT